MFPDINDYDFLVEEETIAEQLNPELGTVPLFDFELGDYVVRDGKVVLCDKRQAVLQWVGFLVKTAYGKFRCYDGSDFGTYIENYIGYKELGFVSSEIKRELEEKCTMNRAILGIDNFDAEKVADKLHISFTVLLNDNTEMEAQIDV